ncbi:hypothetical protein IscW_ISCW019240 [Ixodes scapularis]|uniref:Uncharacterized protein n=1 Tax=Ixodes scapularis TaxID=6945 RepID=B7PR34_IXOSC|nr:hypothetical protein IscW_ISCW019240 [Ixodes scapularis]|eukprot:XP_002436226.1 hypothetical protein IscW_ISCW019240 [Ixodes scapularis]
MSHMKWTFEVIKKTGDDRKAGSVVCKDGLLFLCVYLVKEGIIRYAGLLKGNRKGIVG